MKLFTSLNNRFFTVLVLLAATSCQNEFLAEKPDRALLVPTQLEAFSAILDGVQVFNQDYPALNSIASDDFFITDDGLQSLDFVEQAAYLWDASIFTGQTAVADWNYQYSKIFHANVVLDGLSELEVSGTNEQEYNRIKGAALFHRAYSYFELSQLFAMPYISSDDAGKPGLPLKLESDINTPAVQSNLSDIYDQILRDLNEAEQLLPVTSEFPTRPNRLAAWALLARIYLSISDYDNARLFADRCLQQHNTLSDYNFLDITLENPFPHVLTEGNEEVIYYATRINYWFFSSARMGVDSALYSSYDEEDLRKDLYYTTRDENIHSLTGTYTGGNSFFSGLAVDETLLIRAECSARAGNLDAAVNDLDYLLRHRYRESSYIPFEPESDSGVLEKILQERRKELIGRGLRWSDLRRLNRENGFERTLVRNSLGNHYELLPNSPLYAFPFPDYEN
uniref:Tetratricopeptide domain protein n=1 Tax=Sphingobacterium sp. (strain 21) TaxID=743722 RepID=F4CEI6_SPHS2